jgi:replication initiation and membrane attachment protein DnaB
VLHIRVTKPTAEAKALMLYRIFQPSLQFSFIENPALYAGFIADVSETMYRRLSKQPMALIM